MIFRPHLTHLFLSLFLITSFTAAWPWPPSFPDIEGLILRRQDNSKSDSSSASDSAKATEKAAATSEAAASSEASASESAKASGSDSKSGSSATGKKGKETGKASASATESGEASQTTDVDPRLPPGGVNMITPSPAQTTYYKIGDTVTFAWNYTSLSVTPSKVDVIVSCSANSATYTLSSNASFEKTGSILWDTNPDATGTAPLLTETYTLVVHDAEKPVTAQAEAGHLGSYNQFYFGMYLKQNYTDRKNWKCAVCNDALSASEQQALKFVFSMCAITVLSFTWFVGGFGAIL